MVIISSKFTLGYFCKKVLVLNGIEAKYWSVDLSNLDKYAVEKFGWSSCWFMLFSSYLFDYYTLMFFMSQIVMIPVTNSFIEFKISCSV